MKGGNQGGVKSMNVTEIGIKEGRKHCCGNDCPQIDSAEHEWYVGVPTDKRITENNSTNADRQGNGLFIVSSKLVRFYNN